MVMIPMECPKCGRRGSVPSNRLNTQFNCKNCQAPFYLNSSGDVLAGEPPVPRGEGQRGTAVKEKGKKARELNVDLNLAERWNEMSAPEKKRLILTGSGVALICLGLLYYLNSGSSDPLTERAIYVAKAYADNDLSRIQSLAVEGTSDQLARWFNQSRPQSGIKEGSSKYSISAGILDGSAKSGSAHLSVTFNPLFITNDITADSKVDPRAAAFQGKSTEPADSGALPMLSLRFQTDSRGNWRLDGRTMLDDLQTQPSSSKGKSRSG